MITCGHHAALQTGVIALGPWLVRTSWIHPSHRLETVARHVAVLGVRVALLATCIGERLVACGNPVTEETEREGEGGNVVYFWYDSLRSMSGY